MLKKGDRVSLNPTYDCKLRNIGLTGYDPARFRKGQITKLDFGKSYSNQDSLVLFFDIGSNVSIPTEWLLPLERKKHPLTQIFK